MAKWCNVILMVIAVLAVIEMGTTRARNVPTEAGLTDQKTFGGFGGIPSSGGLPGFGGLGGGGLPGGGLPSGGLPGFGGNSGGSLPGFGGLGGSNGNFFGPPSSP